MSTPKKHLETGCLAISDIHYGKSTSTFNPAIFKTRLIKVADRVIAVQKLHDLDEIVITLGGDVNDGTGIYATQEHHQAVTNVERQADELSYVLAEFVWKLKKSFDKVRIEAVPGNHGRAGKFAHEAASWDVVAYRYLAHMLKQSGVEVKFEDADESNIFLRKFKIRNHNYLLYHGHDIKMHFSIPWYGIQQRVLRWKSSSLAPFDMAIMGHFHISGIWPINNTIVMLTGTAITDDLWALQTLGWESSNIWNFFGVSDSKPMTWNYPIEVTD